MENIYNLLCEEIKKDLEYTKGDIYQIIEFFAESKAITLTKNNKIKEHFKKSVCTKAYYIEV